MTLIKGQVFIIVSVVLLTGGAGRLHAKNNYDPAAGIGLEMAREIRTADAAKAAAAQQFNLLFVPLKIRNPLSNLYYPISPLLAEDFKVVEEKELVWVLVCEPLAGPLVRATVGKMTGLVQFATLELSVE